jgi:hypothetical protein
MASRTVCLTLAAALGMAALGAASPALAAPTAADVETARNLMDVGRAKYDDGDYAGALESFQGADALVGVTSTGLWVGKALMKLGRLIEARDKLYQVSQLPAPLDESEVLREARTEADQLQHEIADRIPEITITLEGLHDGAQPTIVIDGDVVEQQTLRLPRKVDPGDHVARATARGYHDVEVPFTVEEADRRTVTLTFAPNGEPFEDPTQESGRDGGISPLVWAGAGIAGAGVIVGAITGGLSLADAADAENLCAADSTGACQAPRPGPEYDAWRQAGNDKTSRARTLAHVSTVSFAVAGVGAALMITGFIVGGGDDADDVAVTPLVGPGYLGLRGAF